MIRLKVNGQEQAFDGDPDMPLLWYLRDVAGLTGTKFGCGMSLCGACTVHKDGAAIRSCSAAMKDLSCARSHRKIDSSTAVGRRRGCCARPTSTCVMVLDRF